MTQGSEHRRAQRVSLEVPVDMFGSDPLLLERVTTHNVSTGGMFLRTAQPLSPGRRIRVRLATDYLSLEANARVVHAVHDDSTEGFSGNGVAFEALSGSDRQLLDRIVSAFRAQPAERVTAPLLPAFLSSRTVDELRQRHEPYNGVKSLVGQQYCLVRATGPLVLGHLWRDELSHGQVYVPAQLVEPLGVFMDVEIQAPAGRMLLLAEVAYHISVDTARYLGCAPGMVLRLLDLTDELRVQLRAGSNPVPGWPRTRRRCPPAAQLNDALRALFSGVARQDPHAALGIPPSTARAVQGATAAAMRRWVTWLATDTLSLNHAVLHEALQVLDTVESWLGLSGKRGPVEPVQPGENDSVTPTALADEQQQKLAALQRAQQHLLSADVFARSGLRERALTDLRTALTESRSPQVLGYALDLLEMLDERQELVARAQELLTLDPENHRAKAILQRAGVKSPPSGVFRIVLAVPDREDTSVN